MGSIDHLFLKVQILWANVASRFEFDLFWVGKDELAK